MFTPSFETVSGTDGSVVYIVWKLVSGFLLYLVLNVVPARVHSWVGSCLKSSSNLNLVHVCLKTLIRSWFGTSGGAGCKMAA